MTSPSRPSLRRRILGRSVLTLGIIAIWGGSVRRAALARRREVIREDPERWPSVSVVVPAWREAGVLRACLDRLAQLDYPDWDLVVVAAGDDGTFEVAQGARKGFRRMSVLRQRPGGKNGALNDGTEATEGEVLVFLDADSLVGPDYLRALIRPLDGLVVATTGNPTPLCASLVARVGEMYMVTENQVRGRVTLNGSGGIAIRRDVIEALGEFPEGPIADDWDLSQRLRIDGYCIAFAQDAAVRTQRPAALREWWQNEVRWRRIHLRSLLRLRAQLMRGPRATLMHLYPYLTAWGLLLLGAAWLGLQVLSERRLPKSRSRAASSNGLMVVPVTGQEIVIRQLRAVLIGGAVLTAARELAVAVEALVFTRRWQWLPAAPMVAVLATAGQFAAAVATLTARRATVQPKGPRREVAALVSDGGASATELPGAIAASRGAGSTATKGR